MAIPAPATPRQVQEQKYATARVNLGLMLVLTVVNLVLLATGSDTMMLFSASVPYFTGALAMAAVDYGLALNMTLFTVSVTITAVLLLLYFLCWLLSKKHFGWMIAALVLFGIDTAFLAYLFLVEQNAMGIMDVLIHVWVIYYLVIGVISGCKLRSMSDEPAPTAEVPAEVQETASAPSSAERYPADETVKARILAETEFAGFHIVYRRVKRVNELVINGYVYDTYEALMEQPHTLNASINGTEIQCGTDTTSHIFITVNGETLVKKLRLV
ncbi:MAG: hypothetical protein E7553_07015 [Ruminococcaceae bacterium]|nr:hypothetical protein [Oscillospiraceae bacterium]